jgi:hypothetical protein
MVQPLHMMKKVYGRLHPCIDFLRLSLVTEPDVYPLTNMLDFAARAAGYTVFSKIDLQKGYGQITVNPKDVQKTAITNTPSTRGCLFASEMRAILPVACG